MTYPERLFRSTLCSLAVTAVLVSATAPSLAAEPPAVTGVHPNIQTADAGSVQLAAANCVYEVEVAQLGVRKAQGADVKAYAQMLAAEHTRANEELKQLAESKRIRLATEMPTDKQSIVDHLAGSDKFDNDFLKQVGLSDHKKDIALFEKHASNGSDPDIKDWAAATLPKLRAHMTQAEQLAAGQSGVKPHYGK